MPVRTRVVSLIRTLTRGARLDDELDAELRAHVDLLTDEKIRGGQPPDAARRAALLEIGGVEQVKEKVRDIRAGVWLATVARDLRYGWRSLSRNPAVFLAAILSLALGIGGGAVQFSVLDATVLHPLPYPRSDRLTLLVQRDRVGATPTEPALVTPQEFDTYARLTDVFVHAAAFTESWGFINDAAAQEHLLSVTCSWFDVLQVPARLGRVPRASDCRPGAAPVIVLSDQIWRSQFGADTHVVGTLARVDRHPFIIIGVMPPGVSREAAWIPISLRDTDASVPAYEVIGRLRADVSLESAETHFSSVARRLLAARHTPSNPGGIHLERLRDVTVHDYAATMYALAAGMGCVVILTCLNVAILLFARTVARERELGVRVSLGASRARVVRQLVLESVVLVVCGAGAGVVLAIALVDPVSRLLAANGMIAPQTRVGLNGAGLLAGGLIAFVAAVTCGTVPALRAMRRDPARLVVSGSRTTSTPAAARWRRTLVVTQTAIAVPLLCITTALGTSLARVVRSAARYDPSHVVEVLINLPAPRYNSPEVRGRFWSELHRAVASVPGVQGMTSTPGFLLFRAYPSKIAPLNGNESRGTQADVRCADDEFFSTLRVPLLAGRAFSKTDQSTGRHVVVVNRSFANRVFGRESPLGRRLRVTERPAWQLCPVGQEPLEIIGVADDERTPNVFDSNDDPVVPTVYTPFSLASRDGAFVLLRTAQPGRVALADVRRAVAALDPELMFVTRVLDDSIEEAWIVWPRLVASMAGSFAGVTLVLVLVGLFGVLTYSIVQLAPEFAVRLALGASTRQIAFQVLRRGVSWVLMGLSVGVAETVAVGALARHRVWGMETLDGVMVVGVAGSVLLFALVTCVGPARRAMRIDPVGLLRAE